MLVCSGFPPLSFIQPDNPSISWILISLIYTLFIYTFLEAMTGETLYVRICPSYFVSYLLTSSSNNKIKNRNTSSRYQRVGSFSLVSPDSLQCRCSPHSACFQGRQPPRPSLPLHVSLESSSLCNPKCVQRWRTHLGA